MSCPHQLRMVTRDGTRLEVFMKSTPVTAQRWPVTQSEEVKWKDNTWTRVIFSKQGQIDEFNLLTFSPRTVALAYPNR